MIGFNRPDLLRGALESLPEDNRTVYIAIDGPRNNVEEEIVEQCREVANWFQDKAIDRKVFTKFSKENQGCKYGVFSAINWAFECEEKLIILEDDIRPIKQFYDFCDAALKIFKSEQNIWQINGWTPLDHKRKDISLYETTHAHIWGWATWKDRWEKYDLELVTWEHRSLSTQKIFQNSKVHKNFDIYWQKVLDDCLTGKIDTWDSQWLYSMWLHDSMAISPSKTLCGNVGFDRRATHTFNSGGEVFSRLPENDILLNSECFDNLDKSLANDYLHDMLCYNLDQVTRGFPGKLLVKLRREYMKFFTK